MDAKKVDLGRGKCPKGEVDGEVSIQGIWAARVLIAT